MDSQNDIWIVTSPDRNNRFYLLRSKNEQAPQVVDSLFFTANIDGLNYPQLIEYNNQIFVGVENGVNVYSLDGKLKRQYSLKEGNKIVSPL